MLGEAAPLWFRGPPTVLWHLCLVLSLASPFLVFSIPTLWPFLCSILKLPAAKSSLPASEFVTRSVPSAGGDSDRSINEGGWSPCVPAIANRGISQRRRRGDGDVTAQLEKLHRESAPYPQKHPSHGQSRSLTQRRGSGGREEKDNADCLH